MGVEFTTFCPFASILTSPESLVGLEVKDKVRVCITCGVIVSRSTTSDAAAEVAKNIGQEMVTC